MDSSVDFSRENFPDLKIIELGENRGFSGGNLVGLNAAKGEFIAL
jgi:GT2 family glycosyltransferase